MPAEIPGALFQPDNWDFIAGVHTERDYSSQLHVIASNFRQYDSHSYVSVDLLLSRFVFNMLDKISRADTRSPCHENLRRVFHSSMSVCWQKRTAHTKLEKKNSNQSDMLFLCCCFFFFFSSMPIIPKDLRSHSVESPQCKVWFTEVSGEIISYSDTTGNKRQHSMLTQKIINDRYT